MSFSRELEKPRRGRIHDLATQQPEREKPTLEFNVEEYVGDREWEILSVRVRDWLAKGSSSEKAIRLVAKMKFIDPERFAVLDSDMHFLIDTKVQEHILSLDFNYSSWAIDTLSVLYPEKLKEWLSPKIHGIEERFFRYLRAKLWDSVVEEGAVMKLADPKRWPVVISEDSWKEIEKNLRWLCREKKVGLFLNMAASIKILAPDRFEDLGITPEIWDKLLSIVKRSRQDLERSDGEVFTSYVKRMMILAAEKVEMTDHGIEVTMPKKNEHKETIPGRPIRQNF